MSEINVHRALTCRNIRADMRQKYDNIYARMSRICRESIFFGFDANKSRISKSIGSLIVLFRARSLYRNGFRIARRFVLEKSLYS